MGYPECCNNLIQLYCQSIMRDEEQEEQEQEDWEEEREERNEGEQEEQGGVFI